MRPSKLRIRGLASFADEVAIDFDGLGLFAITGPTGAGKTSLLTAMTAALYGRAPEVGDDLRQLINTGCKEARISFEFAAGDRRYRAQRAIHQARNTEVRLEVQDGAAWKPLIRGSREARGEVEKILGLPYEAFTKVVLLPQGQVADFLRGRGQDRRKIMIDLLGLDIYQRIQQAANGEASLAHAQAESLQRLLERDYADATPERLEEVRQARADATSRRETSSRDVALVDAALEAARHEQALAEAHAQAEAAARAARSAGESAAADEAAGRALVDDLAAQARQIDAQTAANAYDPARHLALQRAEVEAAQLLAAGVRRAQIDDEERRASERRAHLARQSEADAHALAEARRDLAARAAEHSAARDAQTELEREEGTRVDVARLRERARQHAADQRDLEAASAAHDELERELRTSAERLALCGDAEREAKGALARAEEDEARHRGLADLSRAVAEECERAGRDLQSAREQHAAAGRAQRAAAREAGVQARAVATAQAALTKTETAERAAVARADAERGRHMAHALRLSLAAGEPCPVCEQAVAVVPASHAPDLAAADAAVEQARARRRASEERLDAARDPASRAAERARGAEGALEAAVAAVATVESALTRSLPADVPATSQWQPTLERRRDAAERAAGEAVARTRRQREAIRDADSALAQARAEHAALVRALADRAHAVDELRSRCAAGASALSRALARAAGRDLDLWLAEAERRLLDAERMCATRAEAAEAARRRTDELDQARRQTEAELGREEDARARRASERAGITAVMEQLEPAIASVLGAADADTLSRVPAQVAAMAAAKSEADRLRAQRASVETELGRSREQLAAARGNVEAARRRIADATAAVEASARSLDAATRAREDAATVAGIAEDVGAGSGRGTSGSAVERIALHRTRVDAAREQALHEEIALASEERALVERIERAGGLRGELAAARHQAAVARELGQLLGGQQLQNWLLADAMRLLVEDASAHLERLSDQRYRLQVSDLDFEVTDRWNADAVRSVRTLSGGEAFLSALALALALADRVAGRAEAAHGHHPLESLFIDEGFGTLDAGETLEGVAEALIQLETTHRMIGVITHLPQLAARLPAQIRVVKEVGSSRVEVDES